MLQLINNSDMRGDENLHERNSELVLKNDSNNSQCCAPQSIRVFAPGRSFVNHPKTHKGVDLLGERHCDADRIRWYPIARPLWLVVIFDRLSDRGILAFR